MKRKYRGAFGALARGSLISSMRDRYLTVQSHLRYECGRGVEICYRFANPFLELRTSGYFTFSCWSARDRRFPSVMKIIRRLAHQIGDILGVPLFAPANQWQIRQLFGD